MHITFHSYSLSLFFLQIKPFYTDTEGEDTEEDE